MSWCKLHASWRISCSRVRVRGKLGGGALELVIAAEIDTEFKPALVLVMLASSISVYCSESVCVAMDL